MFTLLGKKDILGAAETGSGKTLAFGLPILSAIYETKLQNKISNGNGLIKDVSNNLKEEEELKINSSGKNRLTPGFMHKLNCIF